MADAKWIKEYDRECKEIVEAKLTMYGGPRPWPHVETTTASAEFQGMNVNERRK